MIQAETIQRLLEPGARLLSVYLPIAPSDRDTRAVEAGLRNLLDDAEARLTQAGADDAERAALLEPLRSFGSGDAFTEHRSPGLAIFARPGGPPHLEPLPYAPTPGVFIGPDFHIKPLLPLLAADRRFYILALSRGNVRLMSATPFSWTEVPLTTLPLEVQAELDSRPAANVADMDAARIALLVAEPRRVATAVKAALGADEAPLLLAADPSVAGHFQADASLRQMLRQPLHLNPFGISPAELHRKAVEAMRPLLEAELETVLNQIDARLGTAENTVAIRLEEIVAAANEGRVDAVVVAEDECLWGRMFEDGQVHTHGRPAPEEEDLLNLAAVCAMRTGGRAFALPRERLPRQVPAAAALRF